MSFCTRCGAQLGFGRFCTNCGAPIEAATDHKGEANTGHPTSPDETAVRLPPVPPEVAAGPRFPLYAEPTAGVPLAVPTPDPATYPQIGWGTPPPPEVGRRHSRLVWLVPVLLLALVAGLGTWWLVRDDSTDASASDRSSQPPDVSGTPDPTRAPSPTPTQTPTDVPTTPIDPPTAPAGPVRGLTDTATADGPRPTAPGEAVDGSRVRYPASNMLDRDPTTAYRIDGDATGTVITFTLADDSTVQQVGMVNGYAKTDGVGADRRNWYASNRKVLKAEWIFDDGTTVTQTLRRTEKLQTVRVDGAATRTVTLRLLAVSAPGPDPRDTTAISTVQILGTR